MALPASGCSAWPADTPSTMGKAAIEAAMIVRFIGTSAGDGESTRGGLGRCIRARSAARRQGELGVLERLLDHRNAGWVARLALLYAGADVEAQRLLSFLGIHVEVLLVLGDQRLAIVGVARLGERRDRQREQGDGRQGLDESVHDLLHRSIIERRRDASRRRRQSGFLVTPT